MANRAGFGCLVGILFLSPFLKCTPPASARADSPENTQAASAAPVLGLEECIQIALTNQPAIHIQESGRGAALEQERVAKSYFFPQVRFDATYTYLDKPQTASISNPFNEQVTDVFSEGAAFFGIAERAGSAGALAALDNPDLPLGPGQPSFNQVKQIAASQLPVTSTTGLLGRNSLTSQLLAVQPVWTGGKILHRYQQSQLGTQVASAAVDKSRQQTAFQVKRAYHGVQFAEELLKIQTDAIGRFEAIEALVQSLLDVGDEYVTTADLYRVTAVRLAIESRAIQARQARELAYAALKQAAGLDATYEFQIADNELPYEEYDLDREALSLQALALRPEILQAHLGIENTHLEQKLARADYAPDVSLFGRFTALEDDADFPNPNDSQRRLWAAGLTVGVPLFTGGRRRANRHKVELETAQAVQTLQLAGDLIALEVTKTFLEYEEAQQQLEPSRKSLEAAEKAAESYRAQFSGGLIREEDMPGYIEDLVETRLLCLEAQAKSLETLYRYNLALAKLEWVTSSDLAPFQIGKASLSSED